jgi:predicted nucleic-acid-binding Zn-ribbon protein
MHFEGLLDTLLNEREVFHVVECEVCGFDEIYYKDPWSGKQIGRACKRCQFVQRFDFKESK